MPFLRNSWYAAAWEDELLPGTMLARRFLGEAIVLVRSEDGSIAALRDRCPHRFAPLHLGALHGSTIECAYHGLRFGLDGKCALNPHGDRTIPTGAVVQTYPLTSRHLLLWIWMGDSAEADAALIPDLAGLDPDGFAINKGYMHTPANYELMTDNIMDLGHIEFIHQGLLGSEAVRRAETRTWQEDRVVHSDRLTRGEILPPTLEALFESGGTPVDRWLDVTWQPPATMQLVVGVAPTGAPERIGRQTPGVHLMTPETEDSTHYFWSNSRDFRREEIDLHEQLEGGLRYAFEHQDKPMIIAQREAMEGEDFWDLRPVILPGDAGAIRARRILRQMINAEAVSPAT